MRFLALITLCLLALFAFSNVVAADGGEELCACPRILRQVCGSDGTTYPNSCELDCAAKRASRQGRSLSQSRDGAC